MPTVQDILARKGSQVLTIHAEATVLLKSAGANGGTLAGQTVEVYVDREMCATSCRKVLPLLGLELGNPTVTFIDSQTGAKMIMRDGKWQ